MSEINLKDNSKSKLTSNLVISIIIITITVRLLITNMKPYFIDMNGYQVWSHYLADFGPKDFYGSSGFHVVYAPFYQYFLWITGEIVKAFSLPLHIHVYLIKIWSVIFEFIGAYLIYIIARKTNKPYAGFFLAVLYVLNPAVYMNSSIWGQFDSITATMLIGVIALFLYKKNNWAVLLFLVAVLTKPQSALLLPIVIYLYFKDFKFNKQSILRGITLLFSGFAVYYAIVLPFYIPTSAANNIPKFLDQIYWLFDLYFTSIKDYPFATANAFNFWFLFGGQTQHDNLPFFGLTYMKWGLILLVLGLIFALICLVKNKASAHSVFYSSFLVLFTAFLFMTKMHERYLLPAIVFICICVIYDNRHIITLILVSACVFINQFYIYIMSFKNTYWLWRWDTIGIIISALTLLAYALSLYNGFRLFLKPAHTNLRGAQNE